MDIEPYDARHASGIAGLCRELGWPSYSEVEVVERGCTAPGVVVRVAVDDTGAVVGFAQACGDGVVQSFLSQLAVAVAHRRRGVARRLVEETFAATGTLRMDLLTDDQPAFYRSFVHKEKLGFRIYPGR